MTRTITVLVTGVGGRSVGCQILHALLRVGNPYRIVATDADPFSFGLYQVRHRYLVPSAEDSTYMAALLRIVEREKVDVVLPGTEPELRVMVQHRELLAAERCMVLASPVEVVHLCSNKWRLHQWLVTHGFPAPKTVQAADWRQLAADTGFPIVGKPAEQTGGSRHVMLLKDESEVERYRADPPEGCNEILFQEYVGSPESEYTVGVLISRTGAVIDSIVMHRKLMGLSLGTQRKIGGQTHALSSGYSQGYVVRQARVHQCCEVIALQMGIRGPVNIQCRLVGDDVKVFEVHPRFSGTTSIRADVGFNEPDVLIRNFLLQESFGRLDYQRDVAVIRAFHSVVVPLPILHAVSRA